MTPAFRISGIPITLNYSWFLMLGLVGANLATVWFPAVLPDLTRGQNIALAAACAVLLFVCVLAHELSHSLIARQNGCEVDGVTLHVFGGNSLIRMEDYRAGVELKTAAAGPMMSLTLAFFAFLLRHFVFTNVSSIPNALMTYLVLVNGAIAVFNLLPGFPLDGGKALRALLVLRNRDFLHATRISARAGRILAFLLMAYGLWVVAAGNLWGVATILLGIFLREAAASGYRRALMESVYSARTVQDVMLARLAIIPEDTTIERFISDYLWKFPRGSFAVGDEKPVGIVTSDAAKKVPAEKRNQTTVKDIMHPIKESMTIRAGEPALKAYTRALQNGLGRLVVVDDSGRIVGYLSLRDLMR